jgi:hypothetical protein
MRPTILLVLLAILLGACRGAAPAAGTIVPIAPPVADTAAAPLGPSYTTPTHPPVVQTARAAAWAATFTATMARPGYTPQPLVPTPIRTPEPARAKVSEFVPTRSSVATVAAVVDTRSSGLGRSKADWEQTFGPPDATGAYTDGRFRAGFERDRLVQVERIVGAGEPTTKAFVTAELAALLPADRVPLQPIALGGTVRGERFRSAMLAVAVYGTAARGEPADFFVFYQTDAAGGVTVAIVAIGTFP